MSGGEYRLMWHRYRGGERGKEERRLLHVGALAGGIGGDGRARCVRIRKVSKKEKEREGRKEREEREGRKEGRKEVRKEGRKSRLPICQEGK